MKWFGNTVTCFALATTAWLARGAPSPLSPNDERATFELADTNLTVELVAAEPQIRAPVAIAWDADGRMFVAEMTDYPSGPVNGRIRLLEDPDGDGRYESSTVFATNLAYPNGVMAWKNGVLVTAAPDIWFLADTNADGVADVREKILTGFTEGNQQLRVNGLYWGIDNWIYGCNGRSDGEVKWGDGTPAGSIRRHDFRFRPDTKQFEVIAGNSQFGMGHDDSGNRFPVFNNIPIRHVVIEDRYLARQPSLTGIDNVPSISPTNGNRVFALTPPTLLIPQPIGFFTSACGPSIFRGTALPESYRGNYFVCEPVQNVVQRRVLKPSGSTFVAEYADTNKEFLASTDRWFHGVFTAAGPDGAFYIVDFYRDLVEHPHWVAPDLRDKVDWRKGEEHGRIWRIRGKNAKLANTEKLSRATNPQLVKALESENGWTRDNAQRLLFERDGRDTVPSLRDLARKTNPPAQIHALNILEQFGGASTEVLLAGMDDPDARVRRQAVQITETILTLASESSNQEKLRAKIASLVTDAAAPVRLQVACAARALSDDEDRLAMLAALARHGSLDEWQARAILSSAGERPWLLGQRLKLLLGSSAGPQLGLLVQLAKIVGSGSHTEDRTGMFNWLKAAQPPEKYIVLAGLLESIPSAQRAESARGLPMETLLTTALEASHPDSVRVGAIRVAAFQQEAAQLVKPLLNLLDVRHPESVQQAAAVALIEANDAELSKSAFSRAPRCSKATRRAMIVASVRQSRSSSALLDALETGVVPILEIDPVTRQALEKTPADVVKQRAARLFASTVSPDRDAVVQQYHSALKLAADQRRGAAVFEKNCTVCHVMQGVGAKVGPDLSGTGQQPRETLLVQILDPSRQVLPDFVAYTVETKSGESYVGFIAQESATTVTLRRPNEPDVTLSRAELAEFKTAGKSLMPDGLEAGMSEQDVADLIEFLRRPDRTLFSQK